MKKKLKLLIILLSITIVGFAQSKEDSIKYKKLAGKEHFIGKYYSGIVSSLETNPYITYYTYDTILQTLFIETCYSIQPKDCNLLFLKFITNNQDTICINSYKLIRFCNQKYPYKNYLSSIEKDIKYTPLFTKDSYKLHQDKEVNDRTVFTNYSLTYTINIINNNGEQYIKEIVNYDDYLSSIVVNGTKFTNRIFYSTHNNRNNSCISKEYFYEIK